MVGTASSLLIVGFVVAHTASPQSQKVLGTTVSQVGGRLCLYDPSEGPGHPGLEK